MRVDLLQSFFGWCTVINAVLLMVSFLFLSLAGDWIYKIHSRFFSLTRETFNIAWYGFMGLYKILIIVFCFVPWVVLLFLGN